MPLITLLLLTADVSANLLAFFTAYVLREYSVFRLFLDSVQPLSLYLTILPAALCLYILILSSLSFYSARKRLTLGGELWGVVISASRWWLVLMALSYLMKVDYSRLILFLYFALTMVFNSMTRFLARDIQLRLVRKHQYRQNILIVGAGKIGREVARRLFRYSPLGYRVVGFVDDATKTRMTTSVLGCFQDLPALLVEFNIREVYLADPNLSQESVMTMMASVERLPVRFKIVTSIFDLTTGRVDRYDIESIPALEIGRSPSLPYRFAKYWLDLLGSILLLVVLSPLWLFIYWGIKLTSPGPVILRQNRVGLKEFPFTIYKFRTMYQDELLYADGPTVIDDPRVTPFGRFLRRTSLDELPQLINVLRGEMSLVGPRPEMPYKVEHYNDWQRKRFAVKPGLTGLWQILGRKDLPLDQNLEYDFYYINNQSLLLDLEILIRTPAVVLFGKGAY